MLEELLVRLCSPTLAGLKTGNLIACPYSSKEDTIHEICMLNQMFKPKGLSSVPLRYNKERVLIYLFRPPELRRDLSNTEALHVLSAAGYPTSDAKQCLFELIKRLHNNQGFPHEIGLFLGYPPKDVRGFIENQARNYKCVGCWKVYENEYTAKKRFAQYKKCKHAYCQRWENGSSITQLAVSALQL